ncbi:MAG: COR domain-containing protein, partial [Saprospiraceae bacterium]|nr:COR domain-containing protein [Saprospiraceae bacterium]
KLTSLTNLDLRSNQITDIRFLEKLTSLTNLDLRDNQIKEVQPLIKLGNLRKIVLDNNQITDLSGIWEFLIKKNLKVVWKEWYDIEDGEINLKDNPFTTPPLEVVKEGHEAILRYFEELGRSGTHKLMESRLLIVGQGGAGKTSLKRKLKSVAGEMPKPGDTTRGIEIEPLSLKTAQGEDFTLNVWDFGGQNIQHYAHQFFLSGSSLYVLVHNQREQNTNFQYWLNIIEMLGQASPVLILQNEVAGHCDPLDNAGSIRDRFKNVQEPFFAVDLWNAATDGRFETLKNAIAAIASNPELLPHFGTTRPVSYVRVQEKLAAYPSDQQFITWQIFEAICAEEGVTNPDLVRDYSSTFTVLGKCLHFPNDVELRNFIFLRPKWIIDALFSLLYHEIVIAKKGEFEEIDTVKIWEGKEYETMHGKLIRLMENFELCYPVTGSESRRFIVPQRLPSSGTSFPWKEPEAVRVVYRYKFMPKGVITRLICRLHRHIENDHVWSDAVIFAKPTIGRIFVRERYAEDEIWIEAAGKKRSDLVNLVVETIDDIHKESKFANLRVSKLIPCNCQRCQREAEPHDFDYDYLVGRLGKGSAFADCQKSLTEIEIRPFLARVFENGDEPPAYILAIKEMLRLESVKNAGYHKATHQKLHTLQESLQETLDLIAANQTNILQALENDQPDDAVLQGYLTDIMEKLNQVAENQESFASHAEFQEVKKVLKTDADVKGKFKLTWNLLPKILTDLTGMPNIAYEKEIVWDLKALAQQIVQNFQSGHVFLKRGE